jgi:hypothetical protein
LAAFAGKEAQPVSGVTVTDVALVNFGEVSPQSRLGYGLIASGGLQVGPYASNVLVHNVSISAGMGTAGG